MEKHALIEKKLAELQELSKKMSDNRQWQKSIMDSIHDIEKGKVCFTTKPECYRDHYAAKHEQNELDLKYVEACCELIKLKQH